MKLTGNSSHSQVSGKDWESSESPLPAGSGDANPAFRAIPPSADEAKRKILENRRLPLGVFWEASKNFRANRRTHAKKRTATERRDQKGLWGGIDKELWPEAEQIQVPGFKGSSWRDILEMSSIYNTGPI